MDEIPVEQLPTVFQLIRARGFRVLSWNPADRLLPGRVKNPGHVRRFYQKMGHYSFRLFLRELLEHRDDIRKETVTRYCSVRTAEKYLALLLEMGILDRDGNHFRLAVEHVTNFGETLEWYIAEVFRNEFGSDAIYRVALSETQVGGDFDVLASWAGRLVFLEVKSSPPRAVEAPHVRLFLSRVWELLPEVAIFLEDTQLRMMDKIVPLFEEELRRLYGRLGQEEYPVVRLQDELFHVNHCLYIVNSKRGLVHNLRTVLRDYLRNQQQLMGMP